ncbi:hypothetical protein [Falsigemmobacter intermedius]|uniref:hypothetical protein n=1 Tax=Falsigemmobacter intermedius TaxID=1553448 RepID=UPI003F0535B7
MTAVIAPCRAAGLRRHFTKGSAVVIPDHIEGPEELLQIAEYWIAAARGSVSDAGTSRS